MRGGDLVVADVIPHAPQQGLEEKVVLPRLPLGERVIGHALVMVDQAEEAAAHACHSGVRRKPVCEKHHEAHRAQLDQHECIEVRPGGEVAVDDGAKEAQDRLSLACIDLKDASLVAKGPLSARFHKLRVEYILHDINFERRIRTVHAFDHCDHGLRSSLWSNLDCLHKRFRRASGDEFS